ncbi:methyltransferase domain-containing protein [Stenotrophomonas sp. 24(2023)]|uniref:class I SAM-dependent methyltransferase n=1 Tax=Stenotrophomonas sp. 24(2023) TaxID=3068324 RepID=UPI0027E1FF79|nr:methyltransferase domain-containing protein [Stenotrophomonas sp. 24(2023)]WMJ69621.1 methyltransferase domain-containing protein [Stenotrophomonas sp. 24(2023)]
MVVGGPAAATSVRTRRSDERTPLDAADLAAQLRLPHGPAARAIAESMNRSNGALNHAANRLLAVGAGEQVLEIGPGNAAFVADLLQAPGSRYLGIELSPAMVEAGTAQLAARGLGTRAQLQLGDVHALDLADARIDAALAVNLLYFWPTLSIPLAELARVLRPGGRLCVAFGDAGFMRTLPFTAQGFHLHSLADVDLGLRSAGFAVTGWRAHREQGPGNDGRTVEKLFHLLLARRLR